MGEFNCCDSCSCRWFRTLITLSHTCQGEVLSGPHCHESRDIDSTIKETSFLLSNAKCQIHSMFLYLITLHKCVEKKFVKDKQNTSIDT